MIMRKNIKLQNAIGHWKRVATATLRWKVIMLLLQIIQTAQETPL